MPKNTKQGEERRGMVKKTRVSRSSATDVSHKKNSSFTGQGGWKSEGERRGKGESKERKRKE